MVANATDTDLPADAVGRVRAVLEALHARLTGLFDDFEAQAVTGAAPPPCMVADLWSRPEGGGGDTRILEHGRVFERAGAGFSHISGRHLPPSASAAHPEMAGRSYEVMGVSVVAHPRNPFAPTAHMNVRFFIARAPEPGVPAVWWFGGGIDLTPIYGFVDDARLWHAAAHAAAGDYYPAFKRRCDEYFYLPHRGEARGIGGIFYDDFRAGGFEVALSLMARTGEAFVAAYRTIVERRKDLPYGAAERAWQCLRRGRYVEFNLVWDRGTLFGLQSGGRTESILLSMPPEVHFGYRREPAPGSPEARLLTDFLPPRDWLAEPVGAEQSLVGHGG